MLAQPIIAATPEVKAPLPPTVSPAASTFSTLLAGVGARTKHDHNADASDDGAAPSQDPRKSDATATPYVAAAAQAQDATSTAATAVNGAANANQPVQGKTAATSPAAANAANQAPTPPTAADVTARLVAGAPALTSQPSLALATVPHASVQAGLHAQGAAAQPTLLGQAQPKPGEAAATPATAEEAHALHAAAAGAAQKALGADPLPEQAAALAQAVDANAVAGDAAAASGNSAPSAEALAAQQPAQTAPVAPAPATPSDTAPPPSLPVLPATEQVAFQLRQAVRSGVDQIQIQLKPASLGAIEVKLNLTHDGRVTAVISADRSDTLNLLRQDQSGLQQALRDAGLQADSGSLSFNLRGDNQPQAQNGPQRNAGRRGGTLGDEATSTAIVAAGPTLRAHDGAVDIQV